MKAKILLVEDNLDLREILQESLEALGCECICMEDGKEALDELSRDRYTCIISDIQMPNMDGIQMLKQMKKRGIATPVIYITGYSNYTDDLIDKEGGAVVLYKPFKYEQVCELVETYIECLPPVG